MAAPAPDLNFRQNACTVSLLIFEAVALAVGARAARLRAFATERAGLPETLAQPASIGLL